MQMSKAIACSDIPSFSIVLYHADCMDGVAAAWCCAEWLNSTHVYKEISFHPIVHKTPLENLDCKDADVLLLDICFSKEKLLDLCQMAKTVTVLDHHETTVTAFQTLAEVPDNLKSVIDMSRSGCQIAWDYFFSGCPRPNVIEYIGARDIWKWENVQDGKEITTYIYSLPMTCQTIEWLYSSWDQEAFYNYGKIIKEAKDKTVADLAKDFVKTTMVVGSKVYDNVLIGNCPWMFRSDVGAFLYDSTDCDFVALYSYNFTSNSFSVSLRGKDKVNLAEVAEKFNGGGHKTAAAFQTNTLDNIFGEIV